MAFPESQWLFLSPAAKLLCSWVDKQGVQRIECQHPTNDYCPSTFRTADSSGYTKWIKWLACVQNAGASKGLIRRPARPWRSRRFLKTLKSHVHQTAPVFIVLAPSWQQEQDNRFMPSHPDMNTAHMWHVPFCSYSQSTWFSVASADMDRVQSACLWKQKKECVKRLRLQPRKASLPKSLRWNHVFMQSIWRGMRRDRNFPLHWPDMRRIQYWSCRLVVVGLVSKRTWGFWFETGVCRRATSARSKGFVKPFPGFMWKPTSCKLPTVWPTPHPLILVNTTTQFNEAILFQARSRLNLALQVTPSRQESMRLVMRCRTDENEPCFTFPQFSHLAKSFSNRFSVAGANIGRVKREEIYN